MNKISIKLKIIVWYTVIMVFVSVASLLIITSVSKEIILYDSNAKIVHNTNEMARFALVEGEEVRRIPRHLFFRDGIHSAIYKDGTERIDGFLPIEIGEEDFKDNFLREKVTNGEKYLIYTREVPNKSGSSYWIASVVSIADAISPIERVYKTNLILVLIFLVAASVGGYYIISRAFKPVSRISETAKRISKSNDLSERISLGNGKDEIYKLAETFDDMLDKLEKTFEKEKQFTSDASHELRTPVAVINSECEYLLDCAANLDEARESAMSIKRQSDKMSKLISELLTISRMDKNTINLNLEEVDISELLGFICDEQEEIREKNITLVRKIEEGIYAKVDQTLFARMLINLISNAYTYGRENGSITVSLSKTDEKISLSVADDGIGIAEENLPKIWERFYQVDSARKSDEKGNVGLGLSMVKWIAERHNAEISVESELGKGSTFTVTIAK